MVPVSSRCVYLLERERLGLKSIISRSVGWLVKCLFLFYFSVQLSLYMLVCGVMWYVYARARTHKNKTRMYNIRTVKPLLLLMMIVSCFWGLYFRISQCRQLLQLLFSRIRSIVYWCVYDYCNSIHFVSCGKTLASLSFRIQRTKIVCCFFLFSLSLRFAFAYAVCARQYVIFSPVQNLCLLGVKYSFQFCFCCCLRNARANEHNTINRNVIYRKSKYANSQPHSLIRPRCTHTL